MAVPDEEQAGGFVKVWRGLRNNKLWLCTTPQVKAVAITLLLYASWEGGQWASGGKVFSLSRGGRFWTLRQLTEACGKNVSLRNVRTALVTLEKLGFLTQEATQKGTVISIVNWDKYQGAGRDSDTAAGTEATQERHKGDTPIYTKKDKKDKKEKKGYDHAPSVDDVRDEVERCHYTVSAEAFYAYYEARRWRDKNGRPVKDWKRSLAMWQQNAASLGNGPSRKRYSMAEYASAMKGGFDDLSWI